MPHDKYDAFSTAKLREMIVDMEKEIEHRLIHPSGSIASPAAGKALVGPPDQKHTFKTGAQRSQVMPRYDLIPSVALEREALRFTGRSRTDGGALKYGEGNWEKGLPTSDVINHAIKHLTNYANEFRRSLTFHLNSSPHDYHPNHYPSKMEVVRQEMVKHSEDDDDLAAVRWACAVLMSQEASAFHHDSRFAKEEKSCPSPLGTESPAKSQSTNQIGSSDPSSRLEKPCGG
jgi:hypothetical protein